MNEIRLFAVGDISLRTANGKDPFEGILTDLQNCDILFGNLETTLTSRKSQAEKSVVITSAPSQLRHLKEAGFNVLNLANNHILDSGAPGLADTIDTLTHNGISYIGAGKNGLNREPLIINEMGLRVGFLGYDQNGFYDRKTGSFVNKITFKSAINDIKKLKSQCDIIIISLHWGIDYVYYPSPTQISLAHSLIDAGASIILGHHPHVLQGIEKYKSGLIAYSLGNFQFQYSISGPTSKLNTNYSLILSLRFNKSGLISYDLLPIIIDNNFLPRIPNSALGKEIINLVSEISRPIADGVISSKWWFDRIAQPYLEDSLKSWKRRITSFGIGHLFIFFKWLVNPFVLRCCRSLLHQMITGSYPARPYIETILDIEDNSIKTDSSEEIHAIR
jgi:poly-gamma-glutamate synthesis protein (capsule biosynthesis protein)